MAFSAFEIVIATPCWRRSAWLSPVLKKLTTILVAAVNRSEPTPDVMAGKLMPIIREISETTTSNSTSVTPDVSGLALVFPADDIGIDPISTGLAVGAVRNKVRLVAMFPREVIQVRMAPRIVVDFLVGIGPLPAVDVLGLGAQRLQTLLGGGVVSSIQLVRAQGRQVSIDLRA